MGMGMRSHDHGYPESMRDDDLQIRPRCPENMRDEDLHTRSQNSKVILKFSSISFPHTDIVLMYFRCLMLTSFGVFPSLWCRNLTARSCFDYEMSFLRDSLDDGPCQPKHMEVLEAISSTYYFCCNHIDVGTNLRSLSCCCICQYQLYRAGVNTYPQLLRCKYFYKCAVVFPGNLTTAGTFEVNRSVERTHNASTSEASTGCFPVLLGCRRILPCARLCMSLIANATLETA